ncbi:hypothetical protein FDR72_08995 [Campylobacter helveticus]|uniref:hypothetical protein n=1 Tax=Campylobacter helveticus TaxID=28898 RepID=UPI001112B2C2|nr:hypothetical protein [Campylobacter helveticus]TNB59008.1 hypothetical protein FDR72_08995 [Campylobacter helveticus]
MDSLGNSATQTIVTAFTFGTCALAFATLPFLFVLVNGLLKANSGNTQSSSIINVFVIAFGVHFISCIFFMLGIKLLDILNAIYEANYLQEKIFPIFWARGESAVMNLAGASGNSVEDKGAYLQLALVQEVTDWFILLMFWVVFFTATAYGSIQAKKDVMHFNYISMLVWVGIANVVGFFVFILWAKIASLAMFIPNGEDILMKLWEAYQNLLKG